MRKRERGGESKVGKLIFRMWLGILAVGILLTAWGCSPAGRQGATGYALLEDFRHGEICVQIRGELCRTAEDGYTPPSLPPMEGMGVSMKDTPLSFEAEMTASVPVNESGMRDFSLTYTSPEALRGVTVACCVSSARDGTWQEAYTLSLTGDFPVTFEVSAAQVAGLLMPLRGLLPVGDVTDVAKTGSLWQVAVKEASGGQSILTFDTAAEGRCPLSAERQDSRGWVRMRVTEG